MDREITITVSEEEARQIDAQVQSGDFASAQDVLRAGLSMLQGASLSDEQLRDLAAQIDAGDAKSIPLDEAFDLVFARIDDVERKANEKA